MSDDFSRLAAGFTPQRTDGVRIIDRCNLGKRYAVCQGPMPDGSWLWGAANDGGEWLTNQIAAAREDAHRAALAFACDCLAASVESLEEAIAIGVLLNSAGRSAAEVDKYVIATLKGTTCSPIQSRTDDTN